jgi:hypothetical protein
MARATMGFDFGLDSSDTCFKRKNRWLFTLYGISADASSINALPPTRANRPSLSFKEIEVQHVTETIMLPGKPDWKPITLVLYDLRKEKNPVFEWIKEIYDAKEGIYRPSSERYKKPNAKLEMFDGCGGVIETWTLESVWAQNIEFGELDMSSGEVMTCDLTLRYDRAYIETQQ